MREDLELLVKSKLDSLETLDNTGFYDKISYKAGQYDLILELLDLIEDFDQNKTQ